MAKVSGSIASVVRGVSQQIPEQRVDGQHAEQINMMSDPVTGLARRRGTVMELEQPLFAGTAAAALADHRQTAAMSTRRREWTTMAGRGNVDSGRVCVPESFPMDARQTLNLPRVSVQPPAGVTGSAPHPPPSPGSALLHATRGIPT